LPGRTPSEATVLLITGRWEEHQAKRRCYSLQVVGKNTKRSDGVAHARLPEKTPSEATVFDHARLPERTPSEAMVLIISGR